MYSTMQQRALLLVLKLIHDVATAVVSSHVRGFTRIVPPLVCVANLDYTRYWYQYSTLLFTNEVDSHILNLFLNV
jgi:hypothetical protein